MEDPSGRTFQEKLQIDAFKAHVCRVPATEKDPMVKYRYQVRYLKNPLAVPLPNIYQVCYQRHLQLRKAFSQLEKPAQKEFTSRLTLGLKKRYWEIVSIKEAEKIRYKTDTNNYFIPANFVLKTQGTTRARLVLDPSGSLNQALAKAPNLEQNIAQVMRRIQATPVLWSCDIAEAFFRIQTAPDSPTGLFLMDYNKETEELGPGPNSSLVIIRTLVTIMGLLQSPSYLGICREDLAKDIKEDELK